MQRARGVKVGENCHVNPYVLIDLIYPKMVEIGNNVTLGSHSMIFAHSNPSANLFLKQGDFPRKVSKVVIKSGAVINPGAIIIAGVTIGENSIISPRSVVTQDIPDYCIAVGNPARVIKELDPSIDGVTRMKLFEDPEGLANLYDQIDLYTLKENTFINYLKSNFFRNISC